MSIPWHHDFAVLAGISLSLSLSLHLTLSSSLFVVMEPMMFVYSFTIKGYDVIVTMEFFPHAIVPEDFSPKLVDDDSKDTDTFLNL